MATAARRSISERAAGPHADRLRICIATAGSSPCCQFAYKAVAGVRPYLPERRLQPSRDDSQSGGLSIHRVLRIRQNELKAAPCSAICRLPRTAADLEIAGCARFLLKKVGRKLVSHKTEGYTNSGPQLLLRTLHTEQLRASASGGRSGKRSPRAMLSASGTASACGSLSVKRCIIAYWFTACRARHEMPPPCT